MVVLKYISIIVRSFCVGDECTNNLVCTFFINTIEAYCRMLLVEGELFIFGQIIEHLSIVADIVSIDNDIGTWCFNIALIIDVRGTIVIIFLIESQTMIIIIVRSLNNREVYVGIINLDPTLDILVSLIERIEFWQIVIWISFNIGYINLTICNILFCLCHLILKACQICLGFSILGSKIDQIDHRSHEHTHTDPHQNLADLVKSAVIPIRENTV